MAKISSVIDDQNKRRDDYLKGKNKDKHTSHRGKVMGNSQVFKEVKHNPAATKASAFVNKQKKYQTKYNTAADKIEKRAGKTVAAANADTIASGAKTASTLAKIIADATRPAGPNAARQEKAPLSRLGRAAENAAPKLDKTANQYFRKSEEQLRGAKEGLGKAGQMAVDLGFAGTQLAGDAAMNLVAPGAGLASMGVRGFGHGVNTANEQGVTGARAVAYGLGTAAIEAGTEKISAAAKPLRAIYGKGFADDALSKLTRKLTGDSKGRKILAEIGRSAAGEAGEEALADILQVPLQNITLQNGAQFDAEMWADTAYDALLGGILGGALGTAGAVSTARENRAETKGKANAEALAKAMTQAAQKNAQKNAPPVFQTAQKQTEQPVRQESPQAVSDGTHSIQTDTLYIRKKNPQDTVSNAETNSSPEQNAQNVPPQGSSTNNIPSSAENSNNNSDGLGAADRGSLNTAYQNLQEESSQFYPDGANAARPADVPMFDANGNPISKSASTVLGAKAIPDEAVEDIEQMIADGMLSYNTVKDHDSLSLARTKISRNGFDGALEEFRSEVKKGKVSKDLVTLGQTLLNNAANSGDGHAVAEILMLYRSLNTAAGQAMQAASIFRKLNPESQLYGIRRMVDELNETLKVSKKKFNVEISQEFVDKFLQQTDQDGRDAVMKEIYQDVADQVPGSWKEKFDSWRYMAMLTNPRTHIRNIVGNAFFQPIRIIKNGIAAGMEAGLSKAGVQIDRTKSFGVSPELYRAAWNDYNNAKDILGGSKYSEIEDEIEKRRRIYTSPVLGKGLEKIRRVNFALLETEDAVAKRVTYADSLAGYLHAHGVAAEQLENGKVNSKVLSGARNYAAQEALKATYQDRNKFSNTVVKVSKDLGVLGDAVMPFKRTPANILARGFEYSPAGAVKSVYDGLTKIKSGEKTAAEVIDEAAAGLTGTAILALGAQLFLSGLVKGSQGDDKDDKWAQLLGHQGYSLELPDGTSVTLDWLAPASLPFFMGVELASSVGENGWDAESIWSSLKSVANPMLELSMLQSVNDLIDSVQYAEDAPLMAMVPSAIVSYFTQFIPTIGGQIERAAEEKRMMTYTDKNGKLPTDLQYALGRASSRILGWDYQQIPYIDEWGREEATGTPFMRAFHNFLNPAYVSQVEMDKVEKELQRVRDATGETSVFPSRAGRTVSVDGEEKNLNASEYEKYAKKLGKERYNLLKDAIGSSAYQDLSDADKVAFVETAYKYAKGMVEYDQFGKEPPKWYLEARESGDVVGTIRDHVLYGGNEKVKKAVEDVGITRAQYEAITPGADANGNGGVSQEELKNYLDQKDFSRSQKAALWKLINPRWKHNPYA